jgi:hypothetical protein
VTFCDAIGRALLPALEKMAAAMRDFRGQGGRVLSERDTGVTFRARVGGFTVALLAIVAVAAALYPVVH